MSRLRLDRLQGDAGATPKGPNEEDCGGARRANRATVRSQLTERTHAATMARHQPAGSTTLRAGSPCPGTLLS